MTLKTELQFAFDIGPSSIGWAVIDQSKSNKILGLGASIFPEGVNRDTKGAEISKNEKRRLKRQTRRQFFRKKLRKAKVVELLVKFQMFPDVEALYKSTFDEPMPKFRTALFRLLNMETLPEPLLDYFYDNGNNNPYLLRTKALNGEQLTKHQLGRVFYHFAVRRGYKESLQAPLDDGKTLRTGDQKTGKTGINATQELIDKHGFYGSAMYYLDPENKDNKNNKDEDKHLKLQRIRNRYTLRSWYVDEFDAIWEKQKAFYSELLTNNFKNENEEHIKDIIFYQRPLRNQKFLLGHCIFEHKKAKCRKSALHFEEFRMHQTINNIQVKNKPLNEEQRLAVKELFYTKNKFKKEDILKKLKIDKEDINLAEKQSIKGNETHIGFAKIFSKKVWNNMSDADKAHVWHIKINADDKEKTIDYINKKTNWNFNEKQFKQFFDLRLNKDFARVSTKAINYILPFLKKGYLYNDAVLLGGFVNALGKTEWDSWDLDMQKQTEKEVAELIKARIGETIKKRLQEYCLERFSFTNKQLDKLYHHSNLESTKTIDKFPEGKKGDKLINKVRNPLVANTLFQLRKLCNALVKEFGQPQRIRVEMARELKASINQRDEMRFAQLKNEELNNKAKDILDEYRQPHTPKNIRKVLLFKEIYGSNGQAINPFSLGENKPTENFNMKQLFSNIQIEHIIPYSRSLNNSMANLTLCDPDRNRLKGNKTPYEYAMATGKDWQTIKDNIFKVLPYKKAKRFIAEELPDAEQFISRQLNDTRYIAKFAKEYLKYVCKDVRITQGGVTAYLRNLWGLNGILNKPIPLKEGIYNEGDEYFAALDEDGELIESSLQKWTYSEKDVINRKTQKDLLKLGKVIQGVVHKNKFIPKKVRDDHRHHAVDALAIACTKEKYLQEISYIYGQYDRIDIAKKEVSNFPEPWLGFFQDAKKAVDNILVHYEVNNKVLSKTRKKVYDKKTARHASVNGKKVYGQGLTARGQLHEETIYGKRKAPKQQSAGYHIRKNLADLTSAMLDKIVDPVVRNQVYEFAANQPMAEWDAKGRLKIDKVEFFKTDETGKQPLVFMPQKKDKLKPKMPIKKVRIRQESSNAIQLKNINQWVEPGNNYAVVLYDNKEEGKRHGKVITFWEAVEAKRNGLDPINKNVQGEYVMHLKKGDMVLMDYNNLDFDDLPHAKVLSEKLYYLRKFSSSDGKIKLIFVKHNQSNVEVDRAKFPVVIRKVPNTLKCMKVEISLTGKLEKPKQL